MKLDKYSVAKINEIRSSINLTEDEEQVFLLNVKGKSNQEIADRLCVSVRTVGRHIKSIKEKIREGGNID